MIWRTLLLAVVVACANESERARQVGDYRLRRDSLLTAEVVQALLPQTTTNRLIYAPPTDLSYDSLRVKRPDLVLTEDRPRR